MEKMWRYQKQAAFCVFLLFALLHLYIPVLNHYNFKTFAYDYGVYNFAFYDFAHFRISNCPVYLSPFGITFLQDHFSLTLILLSPLYWLLGPLFGTYTLLILQWILILFGGWATYKFIFLKTQNGFLALAAMLYYFILYARFASYQSDCNLAIMGSAVVPAFLYFFHAKKRGLLILSFLFLLTNREDFSLGLFFLCLTLFILYRKDKEQKKLAGILGVLSLLFFIITFLYIIPLLENENRKFSLFNYSALGQNPSEALIFIVSHPLKVLNMLFVNHTGIVSNDGVKAEFYLVYFISGGFILFYRPVYFIAFIPLIAKKMFNDNSLRWGIDIYQSVEVASLLPVFVFSSVADFKSGFFRGFLAILICFLTMCVSVYYIKASTTRAFGFNKVDFLCDSFHLSDYNIKEARRLMKKIPDTASVCASGRLLPHLALREHIYHFPYADLSNYVFIHKIGFTFPFNQADFDQAVIRILASNEWTVLDQSSEFLLLKRK